MSAIYDLVDAKRKSLVHFEEDTPVELRANNNMANGASNMAFEGDKRDPEDVDYREVVKKNLHKADIPSEDEEDIETLTYEFRETDSHTQLTTFEDCFNGSKRVIKAIFSLFLFSIILGCGLVSCGLLLFIASQMNKYVVFKRTGLINETYNSNKACDDGPFRDCDQCGVPICIQDVDENCNQKETVRWIWAMFLCQCVPYFVMCLRSLWKISFKKKKSPSIRVLLLVLLIETLSTIGMFLLLYVVLPYMDSLRGLFLLSGIGFIPSFLKLFNRPTSSTTSQKYLNFTLDILAFIGQILAVFGLSIMYASTKGGNQSVYKEWNEVCEISPSSLVTTDMSPISTAAAQNMTPQYTTPVDITTAQPTLPPLNYEYLQVGELPSGLEMWLIPIALILISVGYWENFIDSDSKLCFGADALNNLRYDIRQYRSKIYLFVGVYKIILTFILLLIQHEISAEQVNLSMLFSSENFYDNKCEFYGEGAETPFNDDWLLAAVIQVMVGILCFYVADLSIKGYMQRFSFSLSLSLVTPIAFLLLSWACLDCDSYWDFGTKTYWNCYSGKDKLEDLFIGGNNYIWLGIIWFPSFLLLTRYIWFPTAIRLAKIDRIFYYPIPCGATLVQSLSLIRKRNDQETISLSDKENSKRMAKQRKAGGHTNKPEASGLTTMSSLSALDISSTGKKILDGESVTVGAKRQRGNNQERNYTLDELKVGYVPSFADDRPGEVPFIYMCATMWHENEKEMLQMLKSIFRVNIDQCAKEKAFTLCSRQNLFYRFEVHIFFDDAFEAHGENEQHYKVNSFVKDFVNTINLAASTGTEDATETPYYFVCNSLQINSVMNRPCTVGSPTRYETPYGGRLVWNMPMGENKIVMHLKDKQMIRHKKRWSQIMYMHRTLGLGIMDQPVDSKYKKAVAQNTFILALDGDVDFKPDAVITLLDMMKRNMEVAAACGRIHPIGSGPMVWYQKFEYSISHWLQKATEHVLGCVLCSPGCFSLFRGSALMDDNVVETYATKSSKPLDFVQYDQGEDRWLCTLLLQQGYRVEYAAAADAYTYAPEGFNEFYNQRRRWITSTFANLLDLLRTGRKTAAKNQNISFLYILYQGLLFAASVLGPATIFLLVIGAFEIAFGTNAIVSAILGLIPVVILIILCFKAKQSTQLLFAALFSVIFAILQMLVIVGISQQMSEQGICSPTSVFTLFVIGSFVLAAILHPQEFTNLFHGFLYYLFIPCMYLLLIVYALCNLHVVTWGTRMVKQTPTEKEKETEEALKKMKKASPLEKTMAFMNMSKTSSGGGVGIDCSPFCIFKCCISGEDHSIREQIEIAKTFNVTQEAATSPANHEVDKEDVAAKLIPNRQSSLFNVDINTERQIGALQEAWIDDSELFPDGEIKELDPKESVFWEIIIREYLYPLEDNKDEKQKLTDGLLDLRNKAVFSFFLIDVLLIVLILGLQQSGLYVEWTCGGTTAPVELDPIGFLFVFVFGAILAIQVIGMLVHRMFTFMQIISYVTVGSNKKDLMPGEYEEESNDKEKFTDEQVVQLIKQIQRFDLEPDTNMEETREMYGDMAPDDIRMVRHDTVNKSSKKVTILTNEDIERKLAARYVYLSNDVQGEEPTLGRSLNEIRRKSSLNLEAIKAMRAKLKLEDKDVSNEEDFIRNAFSEDVASKNGKAPETFVGFNKNPFRRGSVDPRRPSFGLSTRRPSLYSGGSPLVQRHLKKGSSSQHELKPIIEDQSIQEELFEPNGTTAL